MGTEPRPALAAVAEVGCAPHPLLNLSYRCALCVGALSSACVRACSYWLSGLGLVIFGSLGDFAALSMVAQSIVAPLASTTLVTNVLFAHFCQDTCTHEARVNLHFVCAQCPEAARCAETAVRKACASLTPFPFALLCFASLALHRCQGCTRL